MAFLFQGLAVSLPAFMSAQELGIGMYHISVRGDKISAHRPAIFCGNARHTVTFGMDICNFCVQAQIPANILEEADETRDERACPAFGEPHPAFTLQCVDKGVDRTRGKGIAANE